MEKTDRKTVLFIHHGASLGGAPLSLFEIIKRIDRTKYRVVVLLPEEGPFSDLLKKGGIGYKISPLFVFYHCSHAKTTLNIKNICILLKKIIENSIYFPKILKKEKPEIVVINTSTLLLCGLISKIMKRRVIWHIREVISTEKPKFINRIIAAIIRFSSDKVIVNSLYSLQDAYNLGLKNTSLIYNPVDLRKFDKRNRQDGLLKELKINPSDKIIGYVGQLFMGKGWRNLIKAAFLITQRLHNVKFIIVGSSRMMKRENIEYNDKLESHREDALLREAVNGMRLADNFIILGQRSDVEDIFSLMDCFVFPAIVPETFGCVIVEAMASGLPVVASDIGPTSELIVHNITGLLIEPNNSKILSEVLTDLVTHQEKAGNMGIGGRKRAQEFFDAEKIVPEFLSAYGL